MHYHISKHSGFGHQDVHTAAYHQIRSAQRIQLLGRTMSLSLSLDAGKGWDEGASAAKDDDSNALSTALEKDRIIR